jgi:branched-chain amino acid transport system permease protein
VNRVPGTLAERRLRGGGAIRTGTRGGRFEPTPAGLAARAAVAVGLTVFVFVAPALATAAWDQRIAVAASFAVVGLSINVLTGYSGQVSLGHQALVGIGAFVSAFVAGRVSGGFLLALPLAGAAAAAAAVVVGAVAARLDAMSTAVVTLAFGGAAEATLFRIRGFAGGAGGLGAPRPSAFRSDQAYAELCLVLLGLFLVLDWRLSRTKAGRAMVAVRRDPRSAAGFGIDVAAYRMLAFGVSGFLAGVAGSMLAHANGVAAATEFDLSIALVWVAMAVVGGLGSRAGVVVGSALFAVLPSLLPTAPVHVGVFGTRNLAFVTPLVAAVMAVLAITLYPGGIGQQLAPIRRWLAGGPLVAGPRGAAVQAAPPGVLPSAPEDRPAPPIPSSNGKGAPHDAVLDLTAGGAPLIRLPNPNGRGR